MKGILSSRRSSLPAMVAFVVSILVAVAAAPRGCEAAFAPMSTGTRSHSTFARRMVTDSVVTQRPVVGGRKLDFGVCSLRCRGTRLGRRGGLGGGGGRLLLSMAETTPPSAEASPSNTGGGGSLHGQNACFLPLVQLDQDYYAPRIIQIAGAYPGLTADDLRAVTSEPSPPQGQWTYDFSDPDGPQVGTVALDGSMVVASCEDPVVVIAEHPSLGVDLPKELVDPVDLVVLVDRAKTGFVERKFLVVDVGGGELKIGGYATKSDLPPGAEILGQVEQVQIPWLPAMKATKSGFMEVDEYY